MEKYITHIVAALLGATLILGIINFVDNRASMAQATANASNIQTVINFLNGVSQPPAKK